MIVRSSYARFEWEGISCPLVSKILGDFAQRKIQDKVYRLDVMEL